MASGKYQCRDWSAWMITTGCTTATSTSAFQSLITTPTTRAAERAKAELEACGPPEEAKLLLLEGILVLNEASADRLCMGESSSGWMTGTRFLRRKTASACTRTTRCPGRLRHRQSRGPMYAEHCAALSARRTDVTFLNGTESLETLYAQLCGLLDQAAGGDRRCLTSVPV
uniref:SH3 domain-containing protein n=1 Tax=Macrostomum lignano TaxID=282301 RepID=A0A1I8FP73_9PLAT